MFRVDKDVDEENNVHSFIMFLIYINVSVVVLKWLNIVILKE